MAVEAVAGEALGRVGAVVLGFGIAVNLALSPVDVAGRRQSYWGNYVTTTSEFDYPYDQAIPLATRDSEQVTLVGLCSSYDVDAYLSRASRPAKVKALLLPESHLQAAFRDLQASGVVDPGNAVAAIRRDFAEAVTATPGTSVIVHLIPGDVTSSWPETLEGLRRLGEFQRGDRRLVVYGSPERAR